MGRHRYNLILNWGKLEHLSIFDEIYLRVELHYVPSHTGIEHIDDGGAVTKETPLKGIKLVVP